MSANKTAVISLRLADVRALRMRDSGIATLRSLGEPAARALGHDLTAEYAFLALDSSAAYAGSLRELVRSFVWLPAAGALIDYDIAVPTDPHVAISWKPQGIGRPDSVAAIPSRHENSGLLHVIWLHQPYPLAGIDSMDLVGVRIADRVVAFHVETHTARSAVSFDVDGPPNLTLLVTGLAPGEWEIWCAGMLEIPNAEVRPEAGVLRFEGRPGGYFLRRLGG